MKTISLKIPDEVFEKIEKYRIKEKKNRSNYVMEAVVAYNKQLEREEIGKKLREEAKLDRESHKEIIKDFDHLSNEGLENLNDDWS